MTERESGDPRKRRLEGVIPELLKRAVELGVEKATEAPDSLKHFVNELKLPKEIAGYLLSQIDETKNGLFRVVAKEMRDFLEHTNFAGEMQKLLTTVQFEINTTIRFSPNNAPPNGTPREGERAETEAKKEPPPIPKPEVKTDMYVKREERPRERRRPRE
jgi:hypothetical protein